MTRMTRQQVRAEIDRIQHNGPTLADHAKLTQLKKDLREIDEERAKEEQKRRNR